jgi:hypothetical protein
MCQHAFMALINIRNRWVNLAGPFVLFVVIFTGVLVLLGDSFRYAIGFSLTFYVVVALLDGWHGRRRDAKRGPTVAEYPTSVVRVESR